MGFSYLSPYRFDKGVSYINVATALLTYNLTSTETLPSWLSLSRMSTATRFDSTGILVDSAVDTARWDYGYDGTDWKNQGLLVEKQSTNIATQAAQTSRLTYEGSVADIAKTNTAIKYIAQINQADVYICPNAINNLNNIQSKLNCSIFVNKASVSNYLLVRRISSGASGVDIFQYLNSDLARRTNNIADLKIQDCKDWARISYDFAAGTNTNYARYNLSNQFDTSSLTTVAATAILCKFQAEYTGYRTSYITTTNSAATRSQDNLQLNLSNYTGSIKLTYKRQDNETIETKWIDLTNSSNPNLSDYLDVRGLVIRN